MKFSGLPTSSQYRITEQGGDWASAYRITNDASEGDIAQSAGSSEKSSSLSTEWETADKSEDITVLYTNTVKKVQKLVLKKVTTGGKATEKFQFVVKFTNLPESIRSDAGTIVPDDDGTAEADVYLNDGDEITFNNVPAGTKYQIMEKANAGKASYKLTTDEANNAHGVFAKASDVNAEAENDLATETETVDEGENAIVTYTNDMPNTVNIELSKKVSGLYADRSQYFKFIVLMENAGKDHKCTFDYANGSVDHDGTANPESFTTDSSGEGRAEVYLKHGDRVVIKNVPLTANYSITEDAEDYSQSITVNGEKTESVTDHSAGADAVVFTNTKDGVLPTGRSTRYGVAIACAAVIALSCIAVCVLRRHRKRKAK